MVLNVLVQVLEHVYSRGGSEDIAVDLRAIAEVHVHVEDPLDVALDMVLVLNLYVVNLLVHALNQPKTVLHELVCDWSLDLF